tara:strand:- start:502 stop:885 length:384 start_codon:yes stop_codon:yes gene_type:complete
VQGATDGSTEVKVSFPHVTKNIILVCTGTQGTGIKFHFDSAVDSANVVGEHEGGVHGFPVYAVPSGSDAPYSGRFGNNTISIGAKCKEIFITPLTNAQTGFMLYAELTHIPRGDMYELTGSGINSPN